MSLSLSFKQFLTEEPSSNITDAVDDLVDLFNHNASRVKLGKLTRAQVEQWLNAGGRTRAPTTDKDAVPVVDKHAVAWGWESEEDFGDELRLLIDRLNGDPELAKDLGF